MNTSKYELSTLEKQLKIVRTKLSCEKNELSRAQRKSAHYLPKNVRKREQYESRQVLELTERNQALLQYSINMFLGMVSHIDKDSITARFMHPAGLNVYKWPEKEDIQTVDTKFVLLVLPTGSEATL